MIIIINQFNPNCAVYWHGLSLGDNSLIKHGTTSLLRNLLMSSINKAEHQIIAHPAMLSNMRIEIIELSHCNIGQ